MHPIHHLCSTAALDIDLFLLRNSMNFSDRDAALRASIASNVSPSISIFS